MAAFWSPLVQAGLITVLDVSATPAAPFAAVQAGFQQSQAAQLAFYESAAGGGLSPAAAQQLLVQGYHAPSRPSVPLPRAHSSANFKADGHGHDPIIRAPHRHRWPSAAAAVCCAAPASADDDDSTTARASASTPCSIT